MAIIWFKIVFIWCPIALMGLALIGQIFIRQNDAKLRRSGVLPPAGQATMADVERLVRSGQRILAIRCYREIHHVGLAEAKKAIDDMQVSRRT